MKATCNYVLKAKKMQKKISIRNKKSDGKKRERSSAHA